MSKKASTAQQTSLTAPASTPSSAASGSSALAPTGPDASALAALGELAIPDDGLHEIDQSDIRLPTKSLNMKGVDQHNNEIPKSAYYDTVDETFKREVRAVFVSVHKSNVWSQYNESEGRNKIMCRSDDLKVGTMRESGLQRPCKGCPDAQWHRTTGQDGVQRNVRNCSLVHNVVAFDQDEQKLFTIRFKKSALREWTNHLNKHHLGKGRTAGLKQQHVPLFFFEARLRGELAEAGTHAVPVFEKARVLEVDEVRRMAEGASFIRERAADIAAAADEQGEQYGDAEGGAGNGGAGDQRRGDPNRYTDGEGQDFVDAPSSGAAGGSAGATPF